MLKHGVFYRYLLQDSQHYWGQRQERTLLWLHDMMWTLREGLMINWASNKPSSIRPSFWHRCYKIDLKGHCKSNHHSILAFYNVRSSDTYVKICPRNYTLIPKKTGPQCWNHGSSNNLFLWMTFFLFGSSTTRTSDRSSTITPGSFWTRRGWFPWSCGR